MRWPSPIWLAVAFAATLWLTGSCHLVGGTDGLFIEDLGGSSSGTGGGGTGGGGTGGSSTSSGEGANGSAGCIASECPGEDTDCAYRACINGNCQMANEETGTPCYEDGGHFCDGTGYCVECTSNDHCSGLCQDSKCVDASCSDQEQNNGESDIDCGGPCGACPNGLHCFIPADCQSGICTGGTCAPCTQQPDCVDGNLYCNLGNGVCSPKKGTYSACSYAYECSTGFCCLGLCTLTNITC